MTLTKTKRRNAAAAGGILIVGLVGLSALIVVSDGFSMLFVAAFAFIVVGAVVVARAGGNRVGLVLSVIGLALTGSGLAAWLADSGNLASEAIGSALWFAWLIMPGFLLLWYPTGRPPSPRWRYLEWLGCAAALIAASYLVAEELCVFDGGDGCGVWVENPIGIPGFPNPEFGPLAGLNAVVLLGFVVLALASLVVRYRHSDQAQRLQIKWLIFSVVALIILILAEETGLIPREWVMGDFLFGAAVAMLPVSIGLAIFRYRLYEIERIISRTLGYVLVAAALAIVYVAVAVWIPSRLVASQPPLFVAAATLAVAALFNPVRRRLLRVVDRRFYRSRYDAERTLDQFSTQVRHQVDAEELVGKWLDVVAGTMQPVSAGVWVRDTRARR